MSSTFLPPGPDATTARGDRFEQTHGRPAQNAQHQNQARREHLTPFSPQLGSTTASPAFSTNTPAESVSSLSVHYQSSEYSELDDPFFGVNFNTADGASPSFLGDEILQFSTGGQLASTPGAPVVPANTQDVHRSASYLPLSPDKSPSLPGGSPSGQTREEAATRGVFADLCRTSVAPQELSLSHESSPASLNRPTSSQLTPHTSESAESSVDGRVPSATMQSPRVTVSHWDRDNGGGVHQSSAEHPELSGPAFPAARDDTGRWIPDQSTGQSGLDPSARSAVQVDSINDLAAQRRLSDRNQEVDKWLERTAPLSHSDPRAGEHPADAPNDGPDNIPLREISMGDRTENKAVPGQTYFVETGGELTREDLELMRRGRNWEDAPLPFAISQVASPAYQPPTSNEAMQRYERMCRDTDSIVSRAATWGTRRLSLPSIIDTEVQVAGNLLKKLSLNRGDARRPSILEGLRGLVRKPSINSSKRTRAEQDDASSFAADSPGKDTPAKLAPPSPKPGWSRKHSVPSINTTFVDVGSRVASIGASHARTGSVSATPITSPRSPSGLGLSVKKPLNRLRSKSDTSGIVDLWKKIEDDEDDEDDGYEDGDSTAESDKLIDDITPDFEGFQKHLLKLNPLLATTNDYLVGRIAHHQVQRYKGLLNARVKHLQAVSAKNCGCGSMCVLLGGRANKLDSKGDSRGLDPLSAKYDGSDGDATPLEGSINPDSFPQGIPMPPTSSLPAEFECQLCFNAKKFYKPSDWTKHVHEDVQPFTCTWERCKEPKMFKRKADWVRHENEGHRHLEWWTCDVDDCRHVCYRRDNFLQHLVREHKFAEPKVKTKAAMKRAGGEDPTWAKVERCHQLTTETPQREPCRFCGKVFPTWKKLTVHLAKHMEHISLPVLKLVAMKELDENTIISPVQDPLRGPMPHQPGPMGYPNPAHAPRPLGMYPIAPASAYPAGLFSPNFDDLAPHGMTQAQFNLPAPTSHPHHYQTLNPPTAFPSLPVTSAAASGYVPAPQASSYISMAPDIEPFPALSMNALGLGLQDPSAGAQMGYDSSSSPGGGILDPQGLHQQQQQQQQQPYHHQPQYSPQGSVSPYGHSPAPQQGGFF
ncbi:e64189b4-e421-4f78-b175-1279164ab045 [Thermothielavioides terrestris]|uniref:E64189b4-e421-4f78-b175-1279164ab045 n=1 Tax=Thermothielavioides terrestris TaxID=2587410 RepID=A0A3S4ET06_9PEZI|nr:e64189b4-e421-4f78-b175-1279164ab045 [Thermothielavioides terrestris]